MIEAAASSWSKLPSRLTPQCEELDYFDSESKTAEEFNCLSPTENESHWMKKASKYRQISVMFQLSWKVLCPCETSVSESGCCGGYTVWCTPEEVKTAGSVIPLEVSDFEDTFVLSRFCMSCRAGLPPVANVPWWLWSESTCNLHNVFMPCSRIIIKKRNNLCPQQDLQCSECTRLHRSGSAHNWG